jgi:hypothetical protein
VFDTTLMRSLQLAMKSTSLYQLAAATSSTGSLLGEVLAVFRQLCVVGACLGWCRPIWALEPVAMLLELTVRSSAFDAPKACLSALVARKASLNCT